MTEPMFDPLSEKFQNYWGLMQHAQQLFDRLRSLGAHMDKTGYLEVRHMRDMFSVVREKWGYHACDNYPKTRMTGGTGRACTSAPGGRSGPHGSRSRIGHSRSLRGFRATAVLA